MPDNSIVVPQYYGDSIPDKSINMDNFVHDYIDEQHEEFKIFVHLLKNIFSDFKSVADHFETLSDVNNVLPEMLSNLAGLLKYNCRDDLETNVNRDIIKRLLWIYKTKGTDRHVLEAADFANNENWIASTFFVPTKEQPNIVPNPRESRLYYPINELFRHNISTFSGVHRYEDSERWRDGVIVIEAENVNEKTREAIRRVLPAGIKYYYDQMITMFADEATYELLNVIIKELYGKYELNYLMVLDSTIESDRWNQHVPNCSKVFSGNQMLYPHYEIYSVKACSMLPLYGKYDKERYLNIFYLLEQLENLVPNKVTYSDDYKWPSVIANATDTTKSIDIVNNEVYKSNVFNKTARSGGIVYSEILTIITTEDSVVLEKPIKQNTIDITDNTDNDFNNTDSNDKSDDHSISESEEHSEYYERATQVVNYPNSTTLLYYLKMKLFNQYSEVFSVWTPNPIHDIDNQVAPPEIIKRYKGFPAYSSKGTFSGKYALDGQQNVLWVQARYTHVLPSERWYKNTEDARTKIPALNNFADLTEDAIGIFDENLLFSPSTFTNLVYRGPIGIKYFDTVVIDRNKSIFDINIELSDQSKVSLYDANLYETSIADRPIYDLPVINHCFKLYDIKFTDLVLVEASELKTFYDLKISDMLQVDEDTKVKVYDISCDIPYGIIKNIVYHGNLKRHIDEYERAPVDIRYELDHHSKILYHCLARERLILDSSYPMLKDSDRIYDMSIYDSFHSEILYDLHIYDVTVSTYEIILEIPLYEVTADMFIYPTDSHYCTKVYDESIYVSSNQSTLYNVKADELVKILLPLH